VSHVIQISEAASLGMHSMTLLAASIEQALTVKQMAQTTGASEAHLSKVMQRLTKAGLVHSSRGPKGGFILNAKGLEISLLEIFEALDGPLTTSGCLLRIHSCPFSNCLFGGLVEKMTDEFKKYLASKTLGDLAN
jgi:Rrf2 family protein